MNHHDRALDDTERGNELKVRRPHRPLSNPPNAQGQIPDHCATFVRVAPGPRQPVKEIDQRLLPRSSINLPVPDQLRMKPRRSSSVQPACITKGGASIFGKGKGSVW